LYIKEQMPGNSSATDADKISATALVEYLKKVLLLARETGREWPSLWFFNIQGRFLGWTLFFDYSLRILCLRHDPA
jgi:hypothetical protein